MMKIAWFGALRGTLIALATLAVMSSTPCEAAKAKVLLIGKKPDHPFGTHMYMHTCGMLAKCLARAEGVETVISEGWPTDEETLQDLSTIVVYTNPGAELLLDGPHRQQVHAQIKKGVGLVTIHWASAVRKQNLERLGPRWFSYLGGTWVSNVGLHTGDSTLKQIKTDHPICQGWTDFQIHDEYYLNPTITEATPLLQVTVRKKAVVVGWAFERPDGGRSYGTTLGHFYRNFQKEPFRRMVVNAILWTAKVDLPESGADVGLSQEDLALPPKPNK